MPEPTSLAVLANDLSEAAKKLYGSVQDKQWGDAHRQARVVLGLASRAFSKLDGIVTALMELDQD